MTSRTNSKATSGIILAGGTGSRMDNADKGVMQVGGKSLTEILLQSVGGHIDDVIISANRNHDFYLQHSPSVIADEQRFRDMGPLAGLASCLPACRHDSVLVCCCDMPLIPDHLVEALLAGLRDHDAAVISVAGRRQLLFSLTRDSAQDAAAALEQGQRSVMAWLQARDCKIIECEVEAPWLLNVNTPGDLQLLANHMAHSS